MISMHAMSLPTCWSHQDLMINIYFLQRICGFFPYLLKPDQEGNVFYAWLECALLLVALEQNSEKLFHSAILLAE